MVYIVDDDSSVRQALENLLSAAGVSVVCCATGHELLRHYTREPSPGCLLINLALYDIDGIALYQNLARMGHVPPVIFISSQSDVRTSVKAMKAGAFDFVLKPLDYQDLLATIVQALEKDRAEQQTGAELILLRKLVNHLTDRELQVFHAVSEGLLNKQISVRLNIVEQTVKVHRARMMKKLNARSIAAVARIAEKLERAGALPAVPTAGLASY